MLDPNPIRPPRTWLSNPKLIKIKTGCTTKNAGLSYWRVFYNSARNAMDKFRGEKKEKDETVQKQ